MSDVRELPGAHDILRPARQVGDAYDLANCRIIYVFVGFGCFETASVLHAG